MTKTSRHSVADYRVSHSLAHHKTRPGCLGRPWRVRGQCVYDQATLAGPRTAAHDDPKVLTEPQTRGSRQHGVPRRQSNQADSVSRPLRRRAAKMARPARVRILSRNPWVRARRRLFGWKVRLPLLTAQNLLVSTCSRPSSGVSCSSTAVSGFSYQRVASSLLATTTRARETDPLLAGDLTRVRTRFRATETAPRLRTAIVRSPCGRPRCSTEWQHAVYREMLAPEGFLWQSTGLVNVPLSTHRPTCTSGDPRTWFCTTETLPKTWKLRLAYVEPLGGVGTGRRTLVHSCGQLCGYLLCR